MGVAETGEVVKKLQKIHVAVECWGSGDEQTSKQRFLSRRLAKAKQRASMSR